MHIVTNEEMKNGMRMMKYSVNHWWKFKFHRVAYVTGFFQLSSIFIIALCNYLVITISTTVIDIAKDFTALLIIGQFDDIFGARGSPLVNSLVTEAEYADLFRIETTTSYDAHNWGPGKEDRFILAPDPVYENMKRLA